MNLGVESESRPITILLPWCLDSVFCDLFQCMGFRVLWAGNKEELKGMLQGESIDIALEWQRTPEDHPVRDFLHSLGLEVPIILYLNCRKKVPDDLPGLGYAGCIEIPSDINATLRAFCMVLPEDRRLLLEEIMEEIDRLG